MLTPSWHQESSGRSIDVYMNSGLHIDVHWTSKGLLMPTGIKYQAKTCKSYVRDNKKNICLKKVFSEKPILAFHKMKSIRNYIVRTVIKEVNQLMTLILENLFSRTANSDIFRGYFVSEMERFEIFCEYLFASDGFYDFLRGFIFTNVPPQALRKNLFLPKGTKFAKLAKINSLKVYL